MRPRLSIALHAVSVRRDEKWVLKDVSLRFEAGGRWALIGGNGAGKTQLLKLIGTAVWPTPTGHERLEYRLGRHAVDVIEAKHRIVYVGAELQDKYARYGWDMPVRDLLATGLQRSDLLQQPVTASQRRRVGAMLEICGLARLASRRFLSLSYGQKRLALLARGLIQDPDWLLLDEFYNGLDPDFRSRIDTLLGRSRDAGQAWIVCAHRAADVPRGTRGLIELRAGRVHAVKLLSDADLVDLAARARERPAARASKGGKASKTTRLEKHGRHGAPPAAIPKAPRSETPTLLRIRQADLYVEYRAVLRQVNWELREGEHWAVFGANGAGKSSFLKMLYGDLSPALGGQIERTGFPRGVPISQWKSHVGLVSPELQTDYVIDVTVLELVASGRYASIGLSAKPTVEDTNEARQWLRFFGLSSFARRQPRQLSYGQLRRALFARAMAANPRILLLDEPLTGLDPRQRAMMKRLLERLIRKNVTLIIAVHHAEDLPRGMTHGLRLHNRRGAAIDINTET